MVRVDIVLCSVMTGRGMCGYCVYSMNFSNILPIIIRRAYDKSLLATHNLEDRHSHPSPTPHHVYDTTRRRGATYAWTHSRSSYYSGRASSARRPGHEFPHQRPGGHYDPFASPHVRKASGHQAMDNKDPISAESSVWRTAQVIGVILSVVIIGGGFQAST